MVNKTLKKTAPAVKQQQQLLYNSKQHQHKNQTSAADAVLSTCYHIPGYFANTAGSITLHASFLTTK